MKNKAFKSLLSFAMVILLVFSISMLDSSVLLAAPTLDEINRLKVEAADIAAEKDAIEEQIADAENEKYAILAKKEFLDEQITLTIQEIENINEQIALYEELIAEKEIEVQEAQKREDEQLALYRERVRVMEETGSISYLAVIFDATNFSDLLARLDFVFEVMNYDEQLYRDYIAAKEETQRAKDELEETKAGLEQTKSELEAKQAELEQRREEANSFIIELESTIEGYEALIAEASASEEELWAEVYRLIAEYEAAQEKEEDEPEEDESDNPNEDESEGEEPEETEPKEETPQVTGAFLWPAPASYIITSLAGGRIHPIYGYWKEHAGIDIGAYRGSNIIAADGGTVITAYKHSSYGNFAMVDHGNGLVTLYAHMDILYVSAGDVVQKGDVLGLCGDTGATTGPHLHFEVRKDGVLQDPLDYLSGYPYQVWE